MSQENVELVERATALFHAGDAAGALACFSEDVVIEAPARPDVTGGRGRDALRKLIGGWVAAWDDWSEEVEEVRDLGRHVMVVSTQRGREKRTGIEIAMQYAVLYEVRDGELCWMGFHGSPDEAIEAAGLREEAVSRADVDAVVAYLDQAATDPDSVWGIFAPDVEWDLTGIPSAPDFPRVSRGPDAVREFFRRWAGTFDDWGYEVEELMEGPDAVAVRIHQWGRGKGSGLEVDARFWQIWTMSDGRAVRVAHSEDRAVALEATGLRD